MSLPAQTAGRLAEMPMPLQPSLQRKEQQLLISSEFEEQRPRYGFRLQRKEPIGRVMVGQARLRQTAAWALTSQSLVCVI